MHVDHIGARIAYWRKRRGLTQAVLAGLAGVSQGYISHVEAGRKTIERRSTLVGIARALRVTVADLLDQPGDPTDPLNGDVAAAVPAIRAALIEIEEGERRTPMRGSEEMATAVDRVAALRVRSEYATMAPRLPGLLLDAAVHGGLELARIGHATSECLSSLGYRDMAMFAARVAVAGAAPTPSRPHRPTDGCRKRALGELH